jgi:hypothetical protein
VRTTLTFALKLQRVDFMERYMQSITGIIWKLDWNFKLQKFIRADGGAAVFESQVAVLNEWNEVCTSLFMFSPTLHRCYY